MQKIPQYHPSYTEEENLQLHEYIKNAADDELIECIHYLWGMYETEAKVNLDKEMNQWIQDITDRYTLKRKYDSLIICWNEWKEYSKSVLAEYFRQEYALHKKKGKKIFKDESLLNSFIRNVDDDIRDSAISDEFVRKSLLKEDSLYGIKKKPKPKRVYYSLNEVIVEKIEPDQALKQLGRETLKKVLIILLQCADNTGKNNIAPTRILFLTRKYARVSHKKEKEAFSPTLPDYKQLLDKCLNLLKEIKRQKEMAEKYNRRI